MAFYAAFTLFSVLARGKSIASQLVEMDFEQAVSSSFRELSSEEMKKEQRQTLEAIGLDLREVLLPLLLIQKLLMKQVTAHEPG